MYVDIDARISELGRQPYTARKFFLKYQDRILFGTDTTPNRDAYRIYYRFLETDDEYFDCRRPPPPGLLEHLRHLPARRGAGEGVQRQCQEAPRVEDSRARASRVRRAIEVIGPRESSDARRSLMRPGPLVRRPACGLRTRRLPAGRSRLFDAEEIDLLLRSAKEDHDLDAHSFGRADGEGGRVRLSLWNHPGDGIYGMFARCERVVDACEQLLGGEVYHYHSKMIMKDARVGGAWAWHQDYGYWYQNGVLFPDLVERVHRGRPLHAGERLPAGDPGLAPARPDRPRPDRRPGRGRPRRASRRCSSGLPLVHVEMEPGDALFFHSNLLHRSDQNRRDHPRWA